MEGREPLAIDPAAPAVRIAALDMFVDLLSRVEDDPSSDAFYSRLCEAVCRLTSMERAVIFRYDEVRRRVRAAGAYGMGLEPFADAHVTVETIPVAREALEEDRVIEVSTKSRTRSPSSTASWSARAGSSARRWARPAAGSA